MNSKLRKLAGAVDQIEQKKKVFLEIWNDPLYTAGGDTFLGEALELAGLKNVFHDIKGFKAISIEQVIERDPEIFIITAGVPEDLQTLK